MRRGGMAAAGLGLVAAIAGVLWVTMCPSSGQTAGPPARSPVLVLPGWAVVKTWTSQQVIYTVGEEGIDLGGGLKIQFPKGWHKAGDECLSLDPGDDYYISAVTSRPGAQIVLTPIHEAVDGRTDVFDWTAALTVAGARLEMGDIITYTFGDQSGGGNGARVQGKAEWSEVRLALDSDGDGSFEEMEDPPIVWARAEEADHLVVSCPSLTSTGTAFRLAVVAQDEYANVAPAFTGTVQFATTDPAADLPAPYTFGPEDGGIQTFGVALHTPGAHWITVTEVSLAPGGEESNPIVCRDTPPDLQIYWGDLHSHTDFSADSYGRPAASFEYARDAVRLDFFATSDHSYLSGGYAPEEWEATQRLVSDFYEPGRFVTLLAYEWTVWEPPGHRTVYYREPDEEIRRAGFYPTLEGLWSALAGVEALTIPHHTGKRWRNGNTATVEWDLAQPEMQTAIEVYSTHGQSELFDPDHPLSYENVGSPGCSSVEGPHYARDGWAVGQHLGVIASSDAHKDWPGQPSQGLTAVYASELSREAVFDAVREGHTYATTGVRIVLELRVDGYPMGDRYTVTPFHSPVVEVEVAGSDLLAAVELIKYDGISYTMPYSVTEPGSRQVEFSFVDGALTEEAMYYVRVAQAQEVEGRAAMAWSSPVWVAVEEEPAADLWLVKTAGPSSTEPGEGVTYTLTFSNAGAGMASGVVITDSVPVSVTGTQVDSYGAAITETQPGYAWVVEDLGTGEGGRITITGVLSRPLVAGAFTNTAVITSSSLDEDPGNNTGAGVIVVANVAPVLDPIGDRSAGVGQALTFTVMAVDANGDPLSYSLDPGAPPGAGLGSQSGLFAWTPEIAGDYTMTIRVGDSGEPPLEDWETIRIAVAGRRVYLPLVMRR